MRWLLLAAVAWPVAVFAATAAWVGLRALARRRGFDAHAAAALAVAAHDTDCCATCAMKREGLLT